MCTCRKNMFRIRPNCGGPIAHVPEITKCRNALICEERYSASVLRPTEWDLQVGVAFLGSHHLEKITGEIPAGVLRDLVPPTRAKTDLVSSRSGKCVFRHRSGRGSI